MMIAANSVQREGLVCKDAWLIILMVKGCGRKFLWEERSSRSALSEGLGQGTTEFWA